MEVGSLFGLGIVVIIEHNISGGKEVEEAAEWKKLVRSGKRMLVKCL